MKLVQLNATCGVGSTGKICVAVSEILSDRGVENYILYSHGQTDYPLGIKYSEDLYIKRQALRARILGNYGFNSHRATKRLLETLEHIKPDIVHIHNIHGHDCDLKKLFSYFREKQIKVIWTFHDCWAFTGYCPHFTYVQCDQWKNGCGACPQRRSYSWFFDRSRTMYSRKKELFAGLDMTIVTPSQWLADLLKASFLRDYPVRVIHNGIDLEVFQPTPGTFREKYGLQNKCIILGVAYDWGIRKGLDVFAELSKRLDDSFKIVLVGTDDQIDKRLPANILSIHRTQNQKELAEIYTAADIFVNPTREENYPTVNMEAIACGTPVITFRTGGSPESVEHGCGRVVACGDIDELHKEILSVKEENVDAACLNYRAAFDEKQRFLEYVQLY